MKTPQFAAVTISLDTARYKARRPEERRESIWYLVDRLLAGEEVSQSEFEHYELRVAVRPALKPEIVSP